MPLKRSKSYPSWCRMISNGKNGEQSDTSWGRHSFIVVLASWLKKKCSWLQIKASILFSSTCIQHLWPNQGSFLWWNMLQAAIWCCTFKGKTFQSHEQGRGHDGTLLGDTLLTMIVDFIQRKFYWHLNIYMTTASFIVIWNWITWCLHLMATSNWPTMAYAKGTPTMKRPLGPIVAPLSSWHPKYWWIRDTLGL